jgi:hypothetical protein
MKRLSGRTVVPAMLAAVLAFPIHAQQTPGGASDKAAQAPNAEARKFPKWEWFWGFSYFNTRLGSQASVFAPTSRNYYGIRTALKLNLHKNIGLLLDAGGGFGRTRFASQLKPDTGQVLFGPQFTFRSRKFSAFAHPLVGVNTTTLPLVTSGGSVGDLASRRHFAMDFGGGLDINWKPAVAIRLFSAASSVLFSTSAVRSKETVMLQMTLILGSAAVFFVLERTIPLSSLLKKLLWLAPLFLRCFG